MISRPARCFLAAEGALYALFLCLDVLRAGNTTPLKFAAILLAALIGLRAGKGRADRVVSLALAVTALADVFLLVLNRWYAAGVALFLLVQLLYAVRLAWLAGGSAPGAVAVRGTLAGAAGAALGRFGRMTALPGAYIAVFALNLACGVRLAAQKRGRREILFALGLGLFFLCDLCVGAHNLPAALLPAWLPGFARVAMWGFYLPGQMLILASAGALGEERP